MTAAGHTAAPIRTSWQVTPDNAPLGKAHSIGANSELVSSPARRYVEGCLIHEAEIQTLQDLLAVAMELGGSACRLSGTFAAGLHGLALHSGGRAPGATKAYLEHRPGPGVLCFDIDRGQLVRWTSHDEVVAGLRQAVPWLRDIALLVMDSSGSCITLDGVTVRDAGGYHVYLLIDSAPEVPALLDDAPRRCFLAELGRCVVTEGAAIVERSPVDLALRAPTQPDFMVPHLGSPRLGRSRSSSFYPGCRLPAGVELLGAGQVMRYRGMVKAMREELLPAREAKINERAAERGAIAHKKYGGDLAQHVATARQAYEVDRLGLDFVIPLDTIGRRTCSVRELLADPSLAGDGWCLPDPLEPDYGPNKAKFFLDEGKPVIQSMAHGGRTFHLGDARTAKLLTESDTRNAERLASQHGIDLRYCRAWKKWLAWDGRRWQLDDTGEAERRAKATVRAITAEAEAEEDDARRKELLKWAARSEDARRRDNLLRLAQFEPGIPVRPDALDRDPWLLNVQNGTLDLRSGNLREQRRGDLLTKLVPVAYDPAVTAPLWQAFLRRIMRDDQGMIEFLQRAAGYMLTGDVSAEVAFFLVGGGANGKTTFLRTLQDLLGDYARSVPPDLLVGEEKSGASPERMALKGTRMAVCQETAEGRALNAAALKQITSRDKIAARGLYQDTTEFDPSHKLIVGTNHKPRVRSADEGTWRRIFLVPFNLTIPEVERDSQLLEKLRTEHAGILAWAVQGCLLWQIRGGGRAGLAAPESVTEATQRYREAEDALGPFLADTCEFSPDNRVDKPVLLDAYRKWADQNHETPLGSRGFNGRIAELPGVSDAKSGSVRWWRGIGLRDARDAVEPFSKTVPPHARGKTS